MHPPWSDAGRGRLATSHAQLMCECCGFCMTVGVHDASRHTQLQSRAENRCPVMLFSQTAGMGAGRVARSDAYAFLQQRGWGSVEIVELLDHLDADSSGNVDKETLVRAHDAATPRMQPRHALQPRAAACSLHAPPLVGQPRWRPRRRA